jgi:hypothetical protein
VVLLVYHDDAICVHQAVGDEASHRRRNRDAVEIEPAGCFHELEQLPLLLDEARDDPRADAAARRGEGRPRLELASRVGAERPDEKPPEELRKQRYALPDAPASLTRSDLFDDREEWPIGDDQVVEALTDAPFVLARLPVDLFGRELTECAIRLVGDLAALREKRGEVECHP